MRQLAASRTEGFFTVITLVVCTFVGAACSNRLDALVFNPCDREIEVRLIDVPRPLDPDEWSEVEAFAVSATSVERIPSTFADNGEEDYGAQVTVDGAGSEFLVVPRSDEEFVPVLIPASVCK